MKILYSLEGFSLGGVFIFCLALVSVVAAGEPWPVLRHYDQDHLSRIALPIGGIGTGTISLSGRGDLKDWEIVNRAAKGFNAGPGVHQSLSSVTPFFALWTKENGKNPVTKALLGPLEDHEYESMMGMPVINHGLPRFRHASFDATYPFGRVNLSDETVPLEVHVEGFNPLIPGDADASGIPIVILTYQLINHRDTPVQAAVCGNFHNFIGMDGHEVIRTWSGKFVPTGAKKNHNQFRNAGRFRGLYLTSAGVDSSAPQWGTMAFATTASSGVSYRTASPSRPWGGMLLNLWDDFSRDGILDENYPTDSDLPLASLAVKSEIPPHSTVEITFLISWHFPHRRAWYEEEIVGNYYTTRYRNAWDVLEKTVPVLPTLRQETLEFVNAFVNSDLPRVVKEAALFNVSTLRSNTCFRIPSGHLLGWEGTFDDGGCCHGSCTHVWNYEQTTAFLFGTLAASMREVEFGFATRENGLMNFRVDLPLEKNRTRSHFAAADGQMGTIMRMYREWQLSGDNEFLRRLWPRVKAALEFCWISGGWDADQDGVMEGIQHNTMDVEYFGPNPQMSIWYLGALRAAEEMATAIGDRRFAQKCRSLFKNGSKWIDGHLFNGEYYIQKIQVPPYDSTTISMFRGSMGSKDLNNPDYQLGEGCLVDQLVGQYMAHILGLGYLVKPEHVRKTLASILKYNYREDLFDHFNNMRTYAAGDEAALVMASYPGKRPRYPFPYFNEVMTGFEYTAAIGMLYEGMVKEGLACITNIRKRYNGRRRNPFDEAECGHHYARAMTAWASVLALTGFHYSGVTKSMTFSPVKGTFFWSNGYAYGTVHMAQSKPNRHEITLQVIHGTLPIRTFILIGFGKTDLKRERILKEKETLAFQVVKKK